MSTLKSGRSHRARKALFTKGIRRGFLTVAEIDHALPPDAMTDAERWLLFYSLHAARVEIKDEAGNNLEVEDLQSRPSEAESEFEEVGAADGDSADGDSADGDADGDAADGDSAYGEQ